MPEPHGPSSRAGHDSEVGDRSARLWLLALAALVPIAGMSIAVAYTGRRLAGLPPSPVLWAQILVDWALWAAVAPVVILLVRRFPLDRPDWPRGLSRHLALSAVVALAELAAFTWLSGMLPQIAVTRAPFFAAWAGTVSMWFPYGMLIYWAIAIGTHAVSVGRRERRREVETVRLREELTRAQLDALRMQLHPHFMCNALNTVSVFVRDGRPDEAVDIVVALGDLLNRALRTLDTDLVPLREELEFVRGYLAIEEKRFPERLVVREAVDADLLDMPVPTMILQPLVENAMRHGIARKRSAGRIDIEATTEGGDVLLTVRDDGPGPGGGDTNGHGLGLANLGRRLERLYGGAGDLALLPDGEQGARAVVRLPRVPNGPTAGSGS